MSGTGTSTASGTGTSTASGTEWWRTAVVYQVYIRSFCDADGDGLGDVAGLRGKLPHLTALGIDALWINPWYPSPQADAGYDVADYRDIEPAYGTLSAGEELITAAHEAGLRVLLDIVPNHTSDEHAWFVAALAGDAAARARYVFRPGRGAEGSEPPNNWESSFGGPAWTRTTAADGTPGDWYLHLFAPKQPDLDWANPEVREEFEDILRFWFDRGVDGFRIDVAHGLAKQAGLPDAVDPKPKSNHSQAHPAWDQDWVHDIYRGWRAVADSYDPPRTFVAEAWVADPERLARYLRPDELQTAFQFDFLQTPWSARWQRKVIDEALAASSGVGAPSTWVLSNHDVIRHVTRYARSQPDHLVESPWDRARWATETPDLALGVRRARAAILLTLALPGSAYLYQGEEFGLEEVEDIPAARRQDPTFFQTGGADLGRDGCRVPLPWSGTAVPFGFSPDGAVAAPWLPQPESWGDRTAAVEVGDPRSVLNLYRAALRLRRAMFAEAGELQWHDTPDGVLGFSRSGVGCFVNTGADPFALPDRTELVLSSVPLDDSGSLPVDATAWVRLK
jgi:alpha-glucosidase